MDGLIITDIVWDSSRFVLDFKENKNHVTLFAEKNEFSNKPPRPSKALTDIKQYIKLSEIKEKIPNCTHWDKWSKLTNPYDKVQYLARNKNTKDYYKYFEVLKYFSITKNIDNGTSAHMGESSLNAAKSLTYFLPKINWYSSVKKQNDQPTIKKVSGSQISLNKMLESDLENSKDENGYSRIIYLEDDMSMKDNLITFRETVGKVDIITGDCTEDTSYNPTNQEQLVLYSLFSQIVTALHMQSEKGYLILKIFDTITRPTCQLIYYLTKFYENISIIKPRTSRYTNSEKFIVAQRFKGITTDELKSLDNILNIWKPDEYCRLIGLEIPDDIEKQFLLYNKIITENQYCYIEKTIKCNYNEDEIPDKQLEAFQNKNALLFCSNFGIPINLSDSDTDISVCKHVKKKKIQMGSLKSVAVCEKCFCFILIK
jgi:23S rRNA U2552 (ribose-2'-O)-methylase RlmE/FtsJ